MDAKGLRTACKTPLQPHALPRMHGSRAVCKGHPHLVQAGIQTQGPWRRPLFQILGNSCPAVQVPGRTTNSYSGHLHRGRCCEQAWAAGALVEEGVTSSQTDRLDTSLVIGSQWTELERLPEYRMAGQPVHPAANSLTRPAGAWPALRAGVRGETRDPQRPSPRPQGPTSPHSTDSPVIAEICMGVSGWEALPLRLEGRTTVSELGKLLLPNVGACSFSLLSLYLFNDNKASLLHLAHWPVSVC